jgi:hypothetical protein
MAVDGDGHRSPLTPTESLDYLFGDLQASHRFRWFDLGSKLHDPPVIECPLAECRNQMVAFCARSMPRPTDDPIGDSEASTLGIRA